MRPHGLLPPPAQGAHVLPMPHGRPRGGAAAALRLQAALPGDARHEHRAEAAAGRGIGAAHGPSCLGLKEKALQVGRTDQTSHWR